MGKKQAAGGKPRPHDQNARAPQLKVDDIRRTIEEVRATGRTFPAEAYLPA
jgi:hypothetical protein